MANGNAHINIIFIIMIKVSEWYVASQTQIAREGQLIRAVAFLKPFARAQENALLRTWVSCLELQEKESEAYWALVSPCGPLRNKKDFMGRNRCVLDETTPANVFHIVRLA